MATFNDKLRAIREHLDLKQGEMGNACGLSQRDISDIENAKRVFIPKEYIQFLYKHKVNLNDLYDDSVSVDDLLAAMDRDKLSMASEPAATYNLMPRAVTVGDDKMERIPMLDVRASAGYGTHNDDPTYLAEQPQMSIPLPSFRRGSYRAFEIQGDSMEPTLFHGDWVIARAIENPGQIREGYVYAIVTAEDGVLIKRVLNRLKDRNRLALVSDNRGYRTRQLAPEEILELWDVKARMTFNLRNIQKDLQQEVDDLRLNVEEIKQHLNL